jgi:hypothetical protein
MDEAEGSPKPGVEWLNKRAEANDLIELAQNVIQSQTYACAITSFPILKATELPDQPSDCTYEVRQYNNDEQSTVFLEPRCPRDAIPQHN